MTINWRYPCHLDNYQGRRVQAVLYLVIHYVGALGDAMQNAAYYGTTPGIKASAHYFVGHAEDGADIWGSVPENCVASHCGRSDGKYKHPTCRNANSIGIEMCCHQDKAGNWYFDQETIDRTVELARDIMARYGIDMDHVLRHYDVTGKICPAPFVNDASAWENFKERLVKEDMTKEETQAMIDEAVKAVKPEVYTTIPEVPKWAQGLVQRAMGVGVIKGDGTGKLNLTAQDLKTLSMMDGAGMLKGAV
ncbi:MAG TPA: peptidoglycan recognition family protein [Pseudoflavonifractor sp.]|nr:peptidoglycan recognition family protein [Pseudoflavonifractor sp.]